MVPVTTEDMAVWPSGHDCDPTRLFQYIQSGEPFYFVKVRYRASYRKWTTDCMFYDTHGKLLYLLPHSRERSFMPFLNVIFNAARDRGYTYKSLREDSQLYSTAFKDGEPIPAPKITVIEYV
jgi:hypothetical protein